MKLILVAKADLKDTHNSVGTITLGTKFKTNVHANAPQHFNSNPDLLLQKIKLLKKQAELITYPINLYVISVSDQVYQRLKTETLADTMKLADVQLLVSDYQLVGYIQAHKNKHFSVVLNSDFKDKNIFTQVVNLAKQLNIDGNVKITYQDLGYCPKLPKNMPLGQDIYRSAPENKPEKSPPDQANAPLKKNK